MAVKKIVKAITSLKNKNKFSQPELAIFIVIFGLIGFFIYRSFAAAPLVASLEAEQMSVVPGSGVVSDVSASAGKAMLLSTNGTTTGSVNFPGSVTSLTVLAKGTQCSGAPTMNVAVDGTNLLTNTAVSSTSWASYSATPANPLTTGTHSLSISFTNAYAKNRGNSGNGCSRSLYLDTTNFFGPTVVTPAPAVALSASPTSVAAGSASTLTWNSTNATNCSASGAWSGSQPTSGSTSTGAINQNSIYSLTCTGAGGSGSASATVNITSSTIGLASSSIQAGQTLSGTVAWTVTTTGSVASVEFWANNQKLSTSTIVPYTYQLNTTTMPNGANALGVAIVGTDGSRITPQIGTVTVNNTTSGGTSGTVTWTGDFETGNYNQFDGGAQCAPNQATVTTNALSVGGPASARQGSYMFQSLTKNGDNIFGGERCEILKGNLGISNGIDQYYGWSLFMPNSLPGNGLTGQFHGTWDYNQANIQYLIDRGQIGMNGATSANPHWDVGINGGSTDYAVCPNGQYVSGPCSYMFDFGPLSNWKGQWISVITHVKWSDAKTGTVEVWLKKASDTSYTKYVSRVGDIANLWQGYTAYLKLGINRTQSSGLPDAYIWYDNAKRGTSFDSVAQ